jgi:hypothetical protein
LNDAFLVTRIEIKGAVLKRWFLALRHRAVIRVHAKATSAGLDRPTVLGKVGGVWKKSPFGLFDSFNKGKKKSRKTFLR